MKMDLNYSASDCFETFPLPTENPRAESPALEAAGSTLYDARAAYMQTETIGLSMCKLSRSSRTTRGE